jgi:hypothetical protein
MALGHQYFKQVTCVMFSLYSSFNKGRSSEGVSQLERRAVKSESRSKEGEKIFCVKALLLYMQIRFSVCRLTVGNGRAAAAAVPLIVQAPQAFENGF